jgi:hypothetical protein
MNENNLAMEEMPSSEDKPSQSQPMDEADYDTDRSPSLSKKKS